jgi:hypothetical protein
VLLAYVLWTAKPEVSKMQAANVNSVITLPPEAENSIQTSQLNALEVVRPKDSMLVNVVSYSTDPALSFAMVNGKMVREGDFIEPGLKLEEILLDAVVFNSRGKRITRSP